MTSTPPPPTGTVEDPLDIVIVGAGFAGVYLAIHATREGLSVSGVEAGSDVGGTWFWNRYPGARCDVESVDYSYSFDPELEADWRWSERYATQPEILRYIEHVADRYEVRRHFRFGEKVISAHWHEPSSLWVTTTNRGTTLHSRWLLMASGSLSTPKPPGIPGFEDFEGEVHFTSLWPHEGVDVTGRRVGVIGTGSSGIQVVPVLADSAAQLTVFQRTPNFSVPAFNHELDDNAWEGVQQSLPERRKISWASSAGSPWLSHSVSYYDASPEEREATFEKFWQRGGVLFAKAFSGLTSDPVINDAARQFFDKKVRRLITDAETADDLIPSDHPIGTRRICTDSGYFETFNRPHVRLVNLRREPIERMHAGGISTSAGEYPIDVLVCATGFDAMTGALTAIDIRGRGGVSVADVWRDGPVTHAGMAIPGFPNLLFLNGPGSPSVLANMVLTAEHQGAWALRMVKSARERGITSAEAIAEAAEEWTDASAAIAARTLFAETDSWYTGANIPGKKKVFMPYLGGFKSYIDRCAEIEEAGYRGFVLTADSSMVA